MMKTFSYLKNISRCLIWLVSLAVLASCSDDDYLNAIPADSQLLFAVKPAKASGTANPMLLKSLLRVSKLDDIGIDLSENIYFFEDAQANLGLCTKVDDDNKLAKTLQESGLTMQEKRDFKFVALPSNWLIGFSNKTALFMGPVIPTRQQEFISLMTRYLSANDDDGIKSSPLLDKTDSIGAPMALVCQTKALPQQLATIFSIGIPKDADPADIMLAAGMDIKNGRLIMSGGTFSFKKGIDKALAEARKVYRPIKGQYVKSMSKSDFLGLFINVDGNQFHKLVTQNRGIAAMLAGINAAIDMDNILKSVNGDLAIAIPSMGGDSFSLRMAAKLGGAPWLADVDYWKQSAPQGSFIGDWGKNRFYYHSNNTSYYFGVTTDLQYMSGGSEEEALQSTQASSTPISTDLQKLIVGQRLVLVVNLKALNGGSAQALTSLLQPMLGDVGEIVYTLK